MAKQHTPRVKELANKIGGGTDVDPTTLDASHVKSAQEAGTISDGDGDEFMEALREIMGDDDGDKDSGTDD